MTLEHYTRSGSSLIGLGHRYTGTAEPPPPDPPAETLITATMSTPTDGTGNRTAIANAYAAAVSAAADGIFIPAGVWHVNGQINITEGVAIRGAGRASTILAQTSTANFGSAMFVVQNRVGEAFKWSGITMMGFGRSYNGDGSNRTIWTQYTGYGDPPATMSNGSANNTDTDAGLILRGACKNFEIHDARFTGFCRAAIEIMGFDAAGGVTEGQPEGIVWNCEFINNFNPNNGYGVACGGGGLATARAAVNFGSAQQIVIEDCYFERCRHTTSGNYGTRYTTRHNTIWNNVYSFQAIDSHGQNYLGGEAGRGTVCMEAYENDIHWTTGPWGTQPSFTCTIRGGENLVYNNRAHYTRSMHLTITIDVTPGETLNTTNFPYPYHDQPLLCYWWNNIEVPSTTLWEFQQGWNTSERTRNAPYLVQNRDYFSEVVKPGYTALAYPHPNRPDI